MQDCTARVCGDASRTPDGAPRGDDGPAAQPLRRRYTRSVNVIVLPTYNERENLRHALARIREVADGHGVQLHTLIVDDNSPDGTGDLADELAREVPDVSVLHRAGKEGLGKAYIAGFREALAMGAERIFEMDADLSHDASYLPHFLRLIDQGADLVLGSRYVKGGGVENWGLSRKVISRGGCSTRRPSSACRCTTSPAASSASAARSSRRSTSTRWTPRATASRSR